MERNLFLCYLHIYGLCLKVMYVCTSPWNAQVPGTILALQGSCVVVPCMFSYPGPERKLTELTGIWHTEDQNLIYHPDASKVVQRFRGRTSLIGDLGGRNCSLKINRVKRGDTGPFFFRIVIDDVDKYSYRKSPVFIVVKDVPQNPSVTVSGKVMAGQSVVTSCSVIHTCPPDPPLLTWNHRGSINIQSEKLTNGQWRVTSVLTFTTTVSDNNRVLTCTAAYGKEKTVMSSKPLNVKYAPVNVQINSEPTVTEGEAVKLQCSSDSNPAAHRYQWYSVTGALLSEGHTYTLQNITRDTEALYCAAINTEGQSNSTLVQIKVEYPPKIKEGSGCVPKTSGFTCLCIVDSDPPSKILWRYLGGTRSSSHSERHGSVSLETMQVAVGFSDKLSCHASNLHGNATIIFQLTQNGKLLYTTVAVSVLVIVVMVILTWVSRRNWIKENKEIVASLENTSSSVTSRKEDVNSGEYSNCKIYQHMYGNVEVEAEYDPYERVTQDEATYANV